MALPPKTAGLIGDGGQGLCDSKSMYNVDLHIYNDVSCHLKTF